MASAEREQARQSKIKSILHDFKLGKEKKILEGLSALKEIGDPQVIIPMLDVWNKGVSPKVEEEIIEFLSSLKSSEGKDPIMEALLDDSYSKIRRPLLSTIWNCKVDFSDFLMDFVTISIGHDFLTTLECLTIIDTLEGPFEEQTLLETQIILREYAEKQQKEKTDQDEKVKLVAEIAHILQRHENNIVF